MGAGRLRRAVQFVLIHLFRDWFVQHLLPMRRMPDLGADYFPRPQGLPISLMVCLCILGVPPGFTGLICDGGFQGQHHRG